MIDYTDKFDISILEHEAIRYYLNGIDWTRSVNYTIDHFGFTRDCRRWSEDQWDVFNLFWGEDVFSDRNHEFRNWLNLMTYPEDEEWWSDEQWVIFKLTWM